MMSGGYTLGLFFILVVAVIWAAASVLVQYIYQNREFNSPFLLTYIGVSLFTCWLPFRCITKICRNAFLPPVQDSTRYAVVPSESVEAGEDISSAGAESFSDDDHDENGDDAALPWTEEDHIRAAAKIAPVWFLANWTYAGSLAYTSITVSIFTYFTSNDLPQRSHGFSRYSSTVLASTGSLFTFIFAVLTKDEKFGYLKLAGVALGMLGSCTTALQDSSSGGDANSENDRPLLGDLLGLLSAVGYGTYAVQTRILCPRDESLYSMQQLLGYIGLINMVVLSPIAVYQLLYSIDVSLAVVGFLIVKGLFDNVLSDYLWLRAVILTDATVATVGLGLTIPLAFASDVVIGHANVLTPGALLGAVSVLAGFVLVNLEGRATNESDVPGDEDSSLQLQQVPIA